jgi:hypothetical protein
MIYFVDISVSLCELICCNLNLLPLNDFTLMGSKGFFCCIPSFKFR